MKLLNHKDAPTVETSSDSGQASAKPAKSGNLANVGVPNPDDLTTTPTITRPPNVKPTDHVVPPSSTKPDSSTIIHEEEVATRKAKAKVGSYQMRHWQIALLLVFALSLLIRTH
ncbi:MAG: hypothetical protein HYX85_00515 [Chloroflexi bacterium]|nr:hypothetical protein [Chloroflexota bacterium]